MEIYSSSNLHTDGRTFLVNDVFETAMQGIVQGFNLKIQCWMYGA